MKKSAGILVYRKKNNQMEVLLGHMGGPFWEKKLNSWSIIKGEYQEELAIDAAIREFKEETNLSISKEKLSFLCSEKQNSGKLITVFIVESDLDLANFKSNMFTIEYPFHSGKLATFPEIDQIAWVPITKAYEKIVRGQIPFLKKLEEQLV